MRTETLHLTLAFLGNIDIETAEELIDATPVHRLEPGTLTLDQYGVFNRQRILWAGPSRTPTTCKPSTTACGSGCPATACKRPRNRSAPTSPCCATSTPPRPGTSPGPLIWHYDRMVLVASESRQDGSRYRVVAQSRPHPHPAA